MEKEIKKKRRRRGRDEEEASVCQELNDQSHVKVERYLFIISACNIAIGHLGWYSD